MDTNNAGYYRTLSDVDENELLEAAKNLSKDLGIVISGPGFSIFDALRKERKKAIKFRKMMEHPEK